jgi:hypothetical protein
VVITTARTSRATSIHCVQPIIRTSVTTDIFGERILVRKQDHEEHRYCQHEIDGAHDHRVHPAAVISGDSARAHTDHECQRHGEKSHRERNTAAVHHAHEDVASQVVGSEGMVERRREVLAGEIDLVLVVRAHQRREHRAQDDETHHHERTVRKRAPAQHRGKANAVAARRVRRRGAEVLAQRVRHAHLDHARRARAPTGRV